MNLKTVSAIIGFIVSVNPWIDPESSGQRESISVNDPRPLAKAVDILEARHGWIITYEDPRFEQPADIEDVTARVQRSTANARRRTLIPRGGAFSFSYPTPRAGDSASMMKLLVSLVDEYNAAALPGRFRVDRDEETLSVTPISVQGEDGRFVPQSSILSTRVSLAAHTDQTAMSALPALVNSLTQATKRKVVVGMVPLNLLAQTRVENAVSGESARSVLERIVKATGRRVSWRLYYDPGLQTYALNLHLLK